MTRVADLKLCITLVLAEFRELLLGNVYVFVFLVKFLPILNGKIDFQMFIMVINILLLIIFVKGVAVCNRWL